MIRQHLSLLGHKATDCVTGVEGIVDSICFDLYGCVQASLNVGVDKDGKRKEGFWFDIKRLKVVSTKPVMKVPDFDQPEIGAADKPNRF